MENHIEHLGHEHGIFGEWIEGLIEGLGLNGRLTDFISHFLIDTVNVLVLLIVIMTAVYFFTSYINIERLHKALGRLKSVWGYILAIIIGVLSPFCSCSTIPLLMGFISMGVPVSVCICYLTASSMLNLTAIISLTAVTDIKFAFAYIICALVIIAMSSLIFSMLKLDNTIKRYHTHDHHENDGCETPLGRLKNAWQDTLNVLKKSVLFVVIGVGISSAIMAFFSMEYLQTLLNENSILSVFLSTVIGIPIHSDIFSIASLIKLLLQLNPAIALSFTLSTMALSLPSIIILTRALKLKTVLWYCGIIILLCLMVGVFCVILI